MANFLNAIWATVFFIFALTFARVVFPLMDTLLSALGTDTVTQFGMQGLTVVYILVIFIAIVAIALTDDSSLISKIIGK